MNGCLFKHWFEVVEEYYKPARGETRVDAQGKSGRPQVGAKVKSHLFALLDCPARTMRRFFSRQYTKGSCASYESTSRKRWLMMQRIEMISRSNVQLSVHASQSHIHAKQPLPSHIIKSSVMKALTFSTSCHTWTNVQHWQTRRFAARVGQRNNLPIARNFYRHVFWNEPDLAK